MTTQGPQVSPPATAPTPADLVATAALSVSGVLALHPGSFGQVATYLPGRRVEGVRLGAERAISYRDEDFVEVLGEAGGADVILDNMGAKYLGRNVSALATEGRLVIIGMQGGAKGELDLGMLLGKRGSVSATSLRARPVEEKAAICAEVVAEVWPMVADGRIRPMVHGTMPLEEVRAGSSLEERFVGPLAVVGTVRQTTAETRIREGLDLLPVLGQVPEASDPDEVALAVYGAPGELPLADHLVHGRAVVADDAAALRRLPPARRAAVVDRTLDVVQRGL